MKRGYFGTGKPGKQVDLPEKVTQVTITSQDGEQHKIASARPFNVLAIPDFMNEDRTLYTIEGR